MYLQDLVPIHDIRMINWLLAGDRVKNCIVSTVFKHWNGIISGYIHETFKPSLVRESIKSYVALDIPLLKKYKAYPFFRAKDKGRWGRFFFVCLFSLFHVGVIIYKIYNMP